MILSKEFYDRCCPSYKKAVDEFEKDLADIGIINWEGYIKAYDEASVPEHVADARKKNKKFCKIIKNFAIKYLTPKDYWEYIMHYYDECFLDLFLKDRKNFYCIYAEFAFSFHLYYNHEWNSINFARYINDGREHYHNAYDSNRYKLLKFQMKHYLEERPVPKLHQTYAVSEQDLGYPHDRLKQCFRQFERNATRLPSVKLVKKYKKMKTLFGTIKAVETGDVEAWFELLLQVGDDTFVMHNVECRLGHDLFNVKLWKMYITFLKEHGHCNQLFHMYSRYCRFFLEDAEMLEEYKAELAKQIPSELAKLVPFDRLCFIDFKDVVEKEDVTQDEEIFPFDKNLCSTFFDTIRYQKFSLPKPMIRYIAKNTGHRVLRKLFFSCKWFYAKKPTPICYRLEAGSESTYKCETLTLEPDAKPELFLKKTVITGIIDVESNPAFMSTLIQLDFF